MRTINLDRGDERRSRRVQLASAACGLSGSEFIRMACDVTLATMADHDVHLKMMFECLDKELELPKPRAEAVSHI